jgi:hypothetical protein
MFLPSWGKLYLFNILRRSASLADARFLPANSDQFITIVAAIVFRPILYSAENIKEIVPPIFISERQARLRTLVVLGSCSQSAVLPF